MKTRRGSHEWELGNFPASTWAVAAAWIKKTPKNVFPFIVAPLSSSRQAPGAAYLGSQTSDKKFPWQPQTSSPALDSV